jgi:predicted DsbA family dithiol-disulfide isomerase
MGGLIADWQSYNDPFNDIRNPAQMGPQWFQVHEMSGMPLDERIWQCDPPASSYPACIAVKAAERQGQAVAEVYLRRLREAAMMERRNIAHQDILLAVAEQAAHDSAERTVLDLDRFRTDLHAPETVDAFRQDLRDAAYYGIGRFPTLILRRLDGRGIVLVGYRPYEVLCAALEHLVPGLRLSPQIPQEDLAVAYVTHWHRVTACELSEVPGIAPTESAVLLKSLVAKGRLMQADDSQSETPLYIPIS